MASPQVEDGYTRIANELLGEMIKLKLSTYEFQILLAVIRQTYGFQKVNDYISLSQLSKLTRIPSRHCCRTLKKLRNKNLITTTQMGRGITQKVGLQKNYENWKLLPKQGALPKQGITTPQTGNSTTPQTGNHLIVLKKEEKKEEKKYTKERKAFVCGYLIFFKNFGIPILVK